MFGVAVLRALNLLMFEYPEHLKQNIITSIMYRSPKQYGLPVALLVNGEVMVDNSECLLKSVPFCPFLYQTSKCLWKEVSLPVLWLVACEIAELK